MTHSEARREFGTTMTDDEMRALWQRLETDGCKMIRYQPTINASDKSLWHMRITNPAWSDLHEADTAIDVYYEQRSDSSWAMVV